VRRLDLRFWGGVVCVVVSAGVLVAAAPDAFRLFDYDTNNDSWRTPLGRLVHTGDVNGFPHDFQQGALDNVPPGSTFAVLPPVTPEDGEKYYGIPAVAAYTVTPYFQYLLLPSRLVPPEQAQYILCFACDTDPWDARTTWLWKNTNGMGVGKVNGR
jgi:hypothetical protein